jgi:hypothetical protein
MSDLLNTQEIATHIAKLQWEVAKRNKILLAWLAYDKANTTEAREWARDLTNMLFDKDPSSANQTLKGMSELS